MSELTKRVLVALVGIPLVVTCTYLGGMLFFGLVAAIQVLALWEFYRMFVARGHHPYQTTGLVLGTLLISLGWLAPERVPDFLVFCVALILLVQLTPQEGQPSLNGAITLLGLLYVSWFLVLLLQLRMQFSVWTGLTVPYAGGRYVLCLLASIWICDTAAYFGGRKWGKRKLAPVVSPKKTLEGAIFGLVFAFLAFWGAAALFLPQLTLTQVLVSGAVVGVIGQLGDLVESRFKRDTGIKDTSSILPGHGGVLDRFDSLLFVSPFLYGWFGLYAFYS